MRRRLGATLLLLAACARGPGPASSGSSPDGHLVIAHTNDLHTHISPNRAPWLEGEPEIGGFVALSAHLEALRAERGEDAVLYLDGGDLLSGTPLMELEAHGALGGSMVDLLGLVGCDAWVLGNHEFDRGFDNLQGLVSASEPAVLSANVDGAGTATPALAGQQDAVILEANGLRVGVFGLTTPGLHRLASPETMARVELAELEPTARAQVADLDPRTDLVVALTHIGLESDRRLAEEVPGIDLIVGGHSHTAMAAPEQVGSTWIVQAGSYTRSLGVLEVVVADDAIAELSWELRDLLPEPLPAAPDRAVVRAVADLERALADRFGQPVGEAAEPLTRAHDAESGLGRLAADLVREAAGTDIGLYNTGGLRADLVAGPLTRGDLYTVFPFGNQLVSFELSGAELLGAMLRTTHAAAGARAPMLMWSGASWTWRERLGAPEILEVRVGGEPLDLDRTYRIATNSYVAQQWEHHLGVEGRDLRDHGMTVLDAAVAYAARGPLRAPTDARVVRVD